MQIISFIDLFPHSVPSSWSFLSWSACLCVFKTRFQTFLLLYCHNFEWMRISIPIPFLHSFPNCVPSFRDLWLALEYGCLENELLDILIDHHVQGRKGQSGFSIADPCCRADSQMWRDLVKGGTRSGWCKINKCWLLLADLFQREGGQITVLSSLY